MESLQSVQTFDGFVVDTMGLGKIYLALLFFVFQACFLSANLVPNQTIYKPTLCIVPSEIVLHQWKEAIEKFPTLILIIAYGERQLSTRSNWISATAMRETPLILQFWLPHLRYVFNQTNSDAAKVVILTLYKTFAIQTLKTKVQKTKTNRERKLHLSWWLDIIGTVVMDTKF